MNQNKAKNRYINNSRTADLQFNLSFEQTHVSHIENLNAVQKRCESEKVGGNH